MANFCGKCGAKLDETTGLCPNCDAKKESDTHNAKKMYKASTTAENKALQKKKRAQWSIAKKIRRFFLKLIVTILLSLGLASGITGALVYFNVVDIPAVAQIMEQLGVGSNTPESISQFQILSRSFTNRQITDKESALEAINDVAEIIGIDDVTNELGVCIENNVLGKTYYRFRQEYKGIPVYGRSVIIGADGSGKAVVLSGNYLAPGDVSISPSVSENTIKVNIEQYINNSLGITDAKSISIEKIDTNNLCIYNLTSDYQSRLAYELSVNFSSNDISQYQFVVDAETGIVLCATPTIYEEETTGYLASDLNYEKGFMIQKVAEGKYTLIDDSRQLVVKTFNGAVSQYSIGTDDNNEEILKFDEDLAQLVYSDDNIWGNTDAEDILNCEVGATLLINTGAIFDYYQNKLNFNSEMPIMLYYDDGYDSGNNALGGVDDTHGAISIGMHRDVNEIDVIAHEYTHFVSGKIVNWTEGYETEALNEAISDVMGEIIESAIKKTPINWKMSAFRDIANHDSNSYSTEYCYYEHNGKECPIKRTFGSHSKNANYTKTLIDCWVKETNNYPSEYKGRNWFDENDPHINSILISHAAYLMWKGIDGSDSFEPLNEEELANLFYETLYALPSNCTFSQFRALIQNTAECQELSNKQRRCISNAFFQVGITSATIPVMKDQLYVEIYDITDHPYNNYTLYVQHKKSEKLYNAEDISKQGLAFPELGEYQLRIVDNANTDNETIISVTAVEHGGAKELPIFTRCGVSKPDGSLEFNEANNAFEKYLAAVSKTTESGSWTEQLSLDADMSITNSSSKTKTTMTLNSTSDVFNYVEGDLSNIEISSVTDMTIMGQKFAWSTEYQDGVAHYQYTEPVQTSQDLEIDPNFFDFDVITQEAIIDEETSGNQIRFTISGDSMAAAGIAAVEQMNGVDNLKYGDVEVTVTLSNLDTVETIVMVFDASMEYQGFNSDVSYHIQYRFV